MKQYFFPGYAAGENFPIPEESQNMINAHIKVRNEILNSGMARQDKKTALMAHDAKLVWKTIWEKNSVGQEIPTAILTIA